MPTTGPIAHGRVLGSARPASQVDTSGGDVRVSVALLRGGLAEEMQAQPVPRLVGSEIEGTAGSSCCIDCFHSGQRIIYEELETNTAHNPLMLYALVT